MEPMSAGLVVEPVEVLAFHRDGQHLMPGARIRAGFCAVPSGFAVGQADVCLGQLGNKQAGVFAAFGGTDFDDAFFSLHDESPNGSEVGDTIESSAYGHYGGRVSTMAARHHEYEFK